MGSSPAEGTHHQVGATPEKVCDTSRSPPTVAPVADDVHIPCEVCGRPLGIEGEDKWLAIEIQREDSSLLNVNFCMQEHAAEWMSRPLPAGEPLQIHPRTWGERLVDGLFLAVCVIAAAVMLLGVYTVVRWMGAWG